MTTGAASTTIGNYRLGRTLGEGGMGVVYEAEHVTMRRRAAVKVLRAELMRDPQTVQRFFNEARATNEVRHPGIVQIYDCGTLDDGAPWLIMELLEGETLAARLSRLGRISPAVAVGLAAQAASVLAAAHLAGIIHRDLKPENLFLVPDPGVAGGERVKVLDFGIAKLGRAGAAGSLRTVTGVVMGTPVYMSPEQCRGTKQVDARSDIYSLGLIVYQMLAGEPPFLSDGIGELFDMHMNVPPRRLDERNVDVGAALAAVVHQMLEKDPAARPQTMAELHTALPEAAAGAAKAKAGPSRPADPRPPTKTPHPGIAAGMPAAASSWPLARGTQFLPESRPAGPPPRTTTTTLSAATSERETVARPVRPRAVSLALGLAVLAGLGGVAVWRLRSAAAPATHNAPSDPDGPPSQQVAARPVATATETTAPRDDQAPPPPPPAPAPVTVEIITAPVGASVVDVERGRVIGTTPFAQTFPRGEDEIRLRLERKGYQPRTVKLVPARDFRGSFNLERVAVPPAAEGERIIKL